MHPADTTAAYLAGIIVGVVAMGATMVAALGLVEAVARVRDWLQR